jgi:hypothetical protein
MKTLRRFGPVGMALVLLAPAAGAQEPPKPGPEHELLKKWVGTWDTTMKVMGGEVKGVAIYKMELGGLWLASTYEGEFGGMKFQGRGLDSYDAAKKKYVGVFVDSMSTSPLVMEGTYDKAKKTLTMEGEGPGMDGKPTKYKSVAEWKDDNTVVFSLYVGGEKEPGFTITYKRRK